MSFGEHGPADLINRLTLVLLPLFEGTDGCFYGFLLEKVMAEQYTKEFVLQQCRRMLSGKTDVKAIFLLH